MTWAALIDRTDIKFPLPISIRATCPRDEPDNVRLEVFMECPDITTGLPQRVHLLDYPPAFGTVEDPARYLRNFALKALAHELDETFLVDGVKSHDPHTEEVYVPKFI